MSKSNGLPPIGQIKAIQAKLFDECTAENVSALERARLARAWEALEARKAAIREERRENAERRARRKAKVTAYQEGEPVAPEPVAPEPGPNTQPPAADTQPPAADTLTT